MHIGEWSHILCQMVMFIPNVSKVYPQLAEYDPFGGWVGFAVPADTPKIIKEKLIAAYKVALDDPSFKKFCETQMMFPVKLYGDDAQAYVEKSSRVNAYMLWDLGFATVDPASLGLERTLKYNILRDGVRFIWYSYLS